MSSSSTQVVKVKKSVLAACMTCPLCNKLVREATTISLCLHTCKFSWFFVFWVSFDQLLGYIAFVICLWIGYFFVVELWIILSGVLFFCFNSVVLNVNLLVGNVNCCCYWLIFYVKLNLFFHHAKFSRDFWIRFMLMIRRLIFQMLWLIRFWILLIKSNTVLIFGLRCNLKPYCLCWLNEFLLFVWNLQFLCRFHVIAVEFIELSLFGN